MADIFREVDEELSRDRAMQAWRKHGKYVIAFVGLVVFVLAVAGLAAGRIIASASARPKAAPMCRPSIW